MNGIYSMKMNAGRKERLFVVLVALVTAIFAFSAASFRGCILG